MPRGKKAEQYDDAPKQLGAKPDELPHGHAPYPTLTDRPASVDVEVRLKHAGLAK